MGGGGVYAQVSLAIHFTHKSSINVTIGADLAANSLFIALAKILWAFDIKPVTGVNYDKFAYTEGFNIRPQKFECAIAARSELHRQVMEGELTAAESVLERFTPFGE